jgi:GEVED domain/Secretion system C-terminal sorting domain/Fibronectin type III domain
MKNYFTFSKPIGFKTTSLWSWCFGLVFLLTGLSSKAQVSSYIYSQSVGTYTPITSGTNMELLSTASAAWDGQFFHNGAGGINGTTTAGTYAAIPLGFTFNYDNVAYDGFYIGTDGWLKLGQTTGSLVASAFTTPISSTTANTNNVISAFGVDLVGGLRAAGNRTSGSPTFTLTGTSTAVAPNITVGMRIVGSGFPTGTTVTAVSGNTITLSANATTSSTGGTFTFVNVDHISYELSGPSGSQVLTVQWKNVSRFSGFGDLLNFQIKLYEGSDIIEIIYDNIASPSVTFGSTIQVGLKGAVSPLAFFNRTGTGATAWSTSTSGTAANSSIPFAGAAVTGGAIVPESGLTFTYEVPSCFSPSGIVTSGVTTTAANISWTASVPAPSLGYEWEVRSSGTGGSGATGLVASGATAAGIVTASATGLSPNTAYTIWVRGACGASDFSNWASSNLTTPCNPYTVPYFEGFETGYVHNAILAGCFSQASVTGTGSWTINNTFTTYNRAPRTGAWNTTIAWSNEDWMFIPISLTGGTSYTVSFYARQDGATAADSNMAVSYGTENTAAAMTNSIVAATGIINGNYQLITGMFTPATTGTFYVGIKGFMNGNPYYISLDDISIIATPTCLPNTVSATTALTSTTATINWTASTSNPASGYEWEVRTSGVGGSGATGLATSGSTAAGILTANVTGLTTNTSYTIWVRGNCGGDFSPWSSSSMFTGYCPVTTLSQASWLSAFTSTGALTNINHTAAAGTAPGYVNLTATEKIANIAGSTNNISLTTGGPTNGIAIWIDWNNNLVFETSERVFNTTSYITSATGSITVPLTAAAGNYRMRVLVDYNNANPADPCTSAISRGEYKDFTFEVTTPPSCMPTTVSATTAITISSATINWAASTSTPSSGYEWEVRTSGAGGSGATGLVTSGATAAGVLTADVTGLSPQTSYTVWVRGNCGGGDFSTWASGGVFFTPCVSTSLPFSNDFESSTAGVMPVCWSTSSASGPVWTVINGFAGDISAAQQGTKFLEKDYNNSTAIAVSQGLDFSSVTTAGEISMFLHRHASGHATDQYKVYVNTSPSITGATEVFSLFSRTDVAPTVAATGWYNYKVNIPTSFNGQANVFIILEGITTQGFSSYDLGVDSFEVKALPATQITQLYLSHCGLTLPPIDSARLNAYPVENATEYNFSVTIDGNEQVITTANPHVNFSELAALPGYSKTIAIKVRAKVGSIYGEYGNSCNIYTVTQITQVHYSQCSMNVISHPTTKVDAYAVDGASNYEFDITINGATQTINTAMPYFTYSQLSSLPTTGQTIAVKVRATNNGIVGEYGNTCNITVSGDEARPRFSSKNYVISAYPNPFDNSFMVRLSDTSEANIQIFDLNGRLISNLMTNETTEVELGQNLSAGVYLVRIEQNQETQSLKMIKK